jgi:hypothetical protein
MYPTPRGIDIARRRSNTLRSELRLGDMSLCKESHVGGDDLTKASSACPKFWCTLRRGTCISLPATMHKFLSAGSRNPYASCQFPPAMVASASSEDPVVGDEYHRVACHDQSPHTDPSLPTKSIAHNNRSSASLPQTASSATSVSTVLHRTISPGGWRGDPLRGDQHFQYVVQPADAASASTSARLSVFVSLEFLA